MKSTRSTPDKRMNTDSRESRSESEKSKQPKGSNSPDCTLTTSSISSSASPITNDAQVSFSTNIAHTYRSRSKSSVNFGERKDHEGSNEYSKLFDNQQSSNLSSSLINAFQMPQVFPNLNMPSLPDYLPSVSMPSMPNISIPNLQMPSMPSLSIPSMPNLSMPSMPNINIPSISFQLRKNVKSWSQINQAVRESRKKFIDICPSMPFNFNFHYIDEEKVRVYFLSSHKSPDTTIFYCDAFLSNQSDEDQRKPTDNLATSNNTADEINEIFSVDEDLDQQQAKSENNFQYNQLDISNGELENEDYEFEDNLGLNSKSESSSSEESFTHTSIDRTLIRRSIASPTSSIANLDILEWKPLVSMTKVSDSNKPGSQEEDLLSQRKRILNNGIVSFDFNPMIPRFVFTFKNIIYWFDDLEMSHAKKNCPCLSDVSEEKKDCLFNLPAPYMPYKLATNKLTKINATMCLYNADLVAYVADYDLWVCDLVSGRDLRLTNTEYSKTAVMAGKPSFVMQEEFSRFVGFWWRPPCHEVDQNNTFTILCEFVDESSVENVFISSWDGTNENHRFPKAGGNNAKSTLKLIYFSSDDLKFCSKKGVSSVRIEELPISFECLFPEYEYLIRTGWHSSDVIWTQLLNRNQNKLLLVFISLTNKFPPQIIHEETITNHWYNCHDILYFYSTRTSSSPLAVGSQFVFLWSSELSGFRHLYEINVELAGTQPNGIDVELLPERNEQQPLHAKILWNKQITSGNWQVSDPHFWVDEEKDLIYFVGTKDSHLESHLYVVSPSQSSRVSPPRRLSKEAFTHTRIIFDPMFKICIDFQSNLSVPPFAYLNQIISPEHAPHLVSLEAMYIFQNLLDNLTLDDSMEYYDKVQYLGPTPQLFEYKLTSGELIYGFLFKPDFLEPGVKYPILLEIYGGPEVQFVTKSFKDMRQHRRHLIASEGYIVVGFDSRGSKNRGVDFERHIYKRLGQVEIDDQVEALQWLAENTGFIDMNRVAIHGWSYGGYLSLMALATRPDIFKCAIAGAPVTSWFLYDTGYTERYMGVPEENNEAYRLSSVLNYVKHFPNEHNRLMIIHGLMDENVHFAHTAQLIHALILVGKPYNLNIFPYERHSLRKLYCSEHFEATLLSYLHQNL